MSSPKVSVHMITYNHERYVVQALDSALAQKTDFDFEIVVGEDCSTDGTRAVVQDYARRHPARIRLLLHERNVGVNRNYIEAMLACRGEYIAFLEGDDYWTSTDKLQKQADFLDAHPDYTICSHSVKVIAVDNATAPYITAIGPKRDCTIEDVIEYRYPIPTCGVMIRNVLQRFPDWFSEIHNLDYATQLLVAQQGKVRFLDDPMGVYRKHPSGISESTDVERRLERFTYLLRCANAELQLRYDPLFRRRLAAVYRSAAGVQLRRKRYRATVILLARYAFFRATGRWGRRA